MEASVKTMREIAKVQVAFSRKSVVFFAPIIWLAPPPKEEDNPPPLGFWIRIINTSNTEQKYFEKAIESYKKLSLKYPKKSSFFAEQINLINNLKKK